MRNVGAKIILAKSSFVKNRTANVSHRVSTLLRRGKFHVSSSTGEIFILHSYRKKNSISAVNLNVFPHNKKSDVLFVSDGKKVKNGYKTGSKAN